MVKGYRKTMEKVVGVSLMFLLAGVLFSVVTLINHDDQLIRPMLQYTGVSLWIFAIVLLIYLSI